MKAKLFLISLFASQFGANVLASERSIPTILNKGSIKTNKQTLTKKEDAQRWMQSQPVRFLENKGQMVDMEGKTVPFVLFKAQSPGINMYVTERGLTYVFIKTEEEEEENNEQGGAENRKVEYTRIDMDLQGSSLKRENIVRETPSEADFNYFYGHGPDGIYGVKQYEKITVKNIYDGIDWVLYNSNNQGFKYDFIIHPGADPKQLKLFYSSLKPLSLNRNGDMEIETKFGNLTEHAPVSFQNEKVVKTKFIKTFTQRNDKGGCDTRIQFDIGNYDTTKMLTIDPQLVWGTFFGGNTLDSFTGVATDNFGNVLVTGYTMSLNFPLINTGIYYYQTVLTGDSPVEVDVVILKFTNNGNLLWSTFYGGATCASPIIMNAGFDDAQCIGSDLFGNIYVVGLTGCSTFPTQNMTGAYYQAAAAVARPFILKFDNSGNRLWATTFGSDLSIQVGRCKYLVTDGFGNLFICGYGLNGLPTANPGGGAYSQTNAGGNDMFFSKFNAAGVLQWSTYFGGSSADFAIALALDNSGNLFATGSSQSSDLPLLNPGSAYFDNTFNGTEDAVLIKFSNNGNLMWSTYFGGNDYDRGWAIDCDLNGNVFITGGTMSTDFPTQDPGAGAYFDNSPPAAFDEDWFIAKFLPNGSLFWSTYYGGNATDRPMLTGSSKMQYGKMGIGADNCGNVYVAGSTASPDFPLLNDPGCNSYSSSTPSAPVLKFNSSCVRVWAIGLRSPFPSFSPNFVQALTIDNNNNVFLVGEWKGTGSSSLVNPGAGAYYQNISGGSDDGFIVKLITAPSTYTQSQVNSTTCSPCNGSATINFICSEANYNYVWSTGTSTLNSTSATNTIANLCPGTYTVTATSSCNQTQTTTFVITGTTCGGITVSVNSATICSGITPCPTLTATGSGGTAPYTYLWSTTESSQNINPCPTSTTIYTVTITDMAALTATSTATITINPAVSATTTGVNITCNGSNNGNATANPGSGTAPYAYTWSNGQTTQTATGLTQGNYTVTVTDNKGCTATVTSAIISPAPLTGQITKGTANCAACGCKEWIMVNATGGTSPFSYTWPDGYINRYKNNLCPGTYVINIKDKNGCSVDISISSP